MGCFSFSYANPLLVTSPTWGTQYPTVAKAWAICQPCRPLSVMMTQPFGSVGSKTGGVERVCLVLVVVGGVIYPFVQVLDSSQELVGWRLNFLFTCGMHTFLQLQRGHSYPQSCPAVLTALVPTMQSFCSLLKCQTSWRAIVTDLEDLSETLRSYLLLIPPFLLI